MAGGGAEEELPQIGLVASDALRVLGLQTILGDGELCRVVQLSGAGASAPDLRMVVIDSTTTEYLFELLSSFARKRPDTALLVLGVESNPEYVEQVIGAGAKGYLNHAANEAEVRMAIEVVLDGSIWAPRKVLARLLRRSHSAESGSRTRAIQFTKREQEVLRLLVMGRPNREIADELAVDEGTVKAHMGRLMRKAGVDNRTALSVQALANRWISTAK